MVSKTYLDLRHSVPKVVHGIRYQWWLQSKTMNGILCANSLFDWLNEKITDPRTFDWGWDRVRFFGPIPQVRGKEIDARWRQRVSATQPKLEETISARKRDGYATRGPARIAPEADRGTKRNFEEIEEEEEEEEEDDQSEEPKISKWEIWADQIKMTRRYLTENYEQMRRQGVDLPYFQTYCTYGW